MHFRRSKIGLARFGGHVLFCIHVSELDAERDVGGVQIGHLLVDAEGLCRIFLLRIVVGGDFIAFQSVTGESFFRVQVAEGEVDFDLLGVNVEDFFVESDRLGGKPVCGQQISGFPVGVDSVGLGVFFQAKIAYCIEDIGVVR